MFYFHMFFPRQWRRGVGDYWLSTSHRLRIRSLCHNSERVKYFPLLSSSLSLPLKIKGERVGWRQRRRERYNWEVRSTPENSFLSGAHNYDNKLLLLHIDTHMSPFLTLNPPSRYLQVQPTESPSRIKRQQWASLPRDVLRHGTARSRADSHPPPLPPSFTPPINHSVTHDLLDHANSNFSCLVSGTIISTLPA